MKTNIIKKRLLSFLLAVLMVLSVAPVTVLATEIENLDQTPTEVVEQPEEQPAEEIIEEIAEEATKTPTEEEPAENPEEENEEEEKPEEEPEGEIVEKKEFFAVVPGAEAYVTDANGQPVDAEGEGEGDLGSGYYSTLVAAIKAIPADEAQYTVKLLADQHAGEYTGSTVYTINNKQDIVLDLNGKIVSGAATSGDGSALIEIKAGGKLTVDDTSAGKNGMLLASPSPEWHYHGGNDYAGSYASNTITNRGDFVLNNGQILNACTTGSATYPVDCYSGTVTVNGGYICASSSNAIRLFGSNVVCEINGGKIESTWYTIQLHHATGMKLKVTGGEILTTNLGEPYALALVNADSAEIEISGGVLNGNITIGSTSETNTLKISDNAVINGKVSNGKSDNTTTITGGTITGNVTLYGTSSISGGRFNGTVYTVTADGKYYDESVTGGTFDDVTNRDIYTEYLYQGKLYYKTVTNTMTDTGKTIQDYRDGIRSFSTGSGYKYDSNITDDPHMSTNKGYFQPLMMTESDDTESQLGWIAYDIYIGQTSPAWNTAKIYSLESVTTYTLENEGWQTLAEFTDKGYVRQNMLGFEKDPATGIQYMKYNLYTVDDSLIYPSVIAAGYFDRDNGDGTYTVLKAVADIQSTYTVDKTDYISDDYYTSIQGALDDWTLLKNYYAETYASYNFRDYILVLCDNSNEKFTLPAGVTFVIPKGEDGNNLYAYTGKVSAPEGYAVVVKEETDGTYYTVRQEGQQTNIETKKDEQGHAITVVMEEEQDPVAVPDITISGKKTVGEGEEATSQNLTGDELNKAAVEAAAAITENTAVTNFKEVGINEALKAESEAKDKEQKVDVKVDAVVVTQETAVIKELTGNDNSTSTTTFQASFDVKPMVKADSAPEEDAPDADQFKQDQNGEWWKIIPNEDIQGEVTFRLPVQSSVTKDTVAVYHKANAEAEGKGTFQGFFPVQGDKENGKFVELKASEFSVYTYEVMTSVSQNDLFAIPNGDGTYTGYATLDELTTAIGDSTDKTAILLKDYKEVNIYFNNKQFTLDLNGHKLQGASENSNKVTIMNSDLENYALLQAEGVYANDVSALCSDGYATRTPEGDGAVENSEVFKPTSGTYQVVVDVTTGTDRVADNDEVDVFAGDIVTVTVSVLGAKYAAADITLSYDKDNFAVYSAPRSGWPHNDAAGTFRFRRANPDQGIGYYQPGLMPNATFKFTVKEGNEVILKDMFSVKAVDAYITPGWSDAGTTLPAEKLNDDQLIDDWANIRLKMMNASVTPNNGLSYKEIGQKLLADGYTASNALDGTIIDDATISYAILTRAEADGTVQMKDESGNLLFYNGDGYLVTEDTGTPAYEPAKAPAAEDYQTVQPTVTDAGDYTIFWKIDRAGYIGVSGKENVSIAPLNVTLNWTMPKDNKDAVAVSGTQGEEGYVAGYTPIVIKKTDMAANSGAGETDGKGDKITADYWGSYSESGFGFSTTAVTSETIGTTKNIIASVVALNQNRIATVTMTGKPATAEADVMKAVGTYEFTADLGSNYNISNPTVTVLVDGGKIIGYDLSATTEGASVYYDGKDHTATVMTPGENATPDVTVKYCYSTDNGENFTEWGNDIPVLTNSNPFPYIVKMQLSKDSFYTQEKTFNFSIKPVQYYTEKTDYVVGWDLVLCYTDEAVPSFEYDGEVMYDVTSFKYMRDDDEHEYAHVYAIYIEGNAETSKVLPSNTALDIEGNDSYKVLLNNEKGRLDVNMTTNGKVDIYDLTAVQGIYNVNRIYLTGEGATGALAELTEQERMAIVLRADVNNDKMVDTMDVTYIMNDMDN